MCARWLLNRSRRDHERLRDRLVRQAASRESQHIDLAIGQIGGPLAPGPRAASRFDHGGHGIGIKPALLRLQAHDARCALGIVSGAVGARFAESVQYVRRREQPRLAGQGRAGHAPVIPGAVQALMMAARERSQLDQRPGSLEHALGPVSVQANQIQLARAERTVTLPRPGRHARSSDVVDERSPPQPGANVVRQTRQRSRRVRQRRHASGVTQRESALQIRQIPERLDQSIELVAADPRLRRRFHLDDGRHGVCRGEGSHERLRI